MLRVLSDLSPLIHFASCWAMIGIIWLVQIVHYPLYDKVGAQNFRSYEDAHVFRISFIVMPLMFIELISGGVILYDHWIDALFPAAALGMALLGIIWASTFLIQARLHLKLLDGFSEAVFRDLVRSNWLRTAAWTVRGFLAALILISVWCHA